MTQTYTYRGDPGNYYTPSQTYQLTIQISRFLGRIKIYVACLDYNCEHIDGIRKYRNIDKFLEEWSVK